MKKNNKDQQKDHPEVMDIKHICEISPKTKTTKGVCEKVSNHQQNTGNKESTKK